jgi:hypothetical protein
VKQGIPLAEQLRDIHQPPADFWWPPAPGWWLLAALLLMLSGWLSWRWWRRTAWRRQARAELDRCARAYRDHGDARRLAMSVEMLLRRVAMVKRSRQAVAALHGEDWLALLDELGGGSGFTQGAGRALLEAPWDARARIDGEALLALAYAWLRSVA